MTDYINNYLNTLIFCIIAKAVSVGLLVLLITDLGWDFVFLIMTVELGLIIIVIYSMYTIYKIDKKIKQAYEDSLKEKPKIETCPDFYVRDVVSDETANNGHTICKNVYTSGDNRYTYRFPYSDNIDLNAINTSAKTITDVCANNQHTYDTISWTDFKARCGILDTYTPL